MMGNESDPWHWKDLLFLVTWTAVSVCGGIGGTVVGWFLSPFSTFKNTDTAMAVLTWLHYPSTYWPYVALGAGAAGFAYCFANLWR